MSKKIPVTLAAAGCSLFLAVPSGFGQGSLTPPGAPAATMKTLSQIEPRTPISSLPYSITNPGAYYVTANLAVGSAVNGITISVDNVSLDLGGFTLTGFGTANSAVLVSGARCNLFLRNGIVRSWGTGVNAAQAYNSKFENLLLFNHPANAGLQTGDKCIVVDCVAATNLIGILVRDGCLVQQCNASFNSNGIAGGSGTVMIGCVATSSEGWGFAVGTNCTLSNCSASQNGHIGLTGGILTGDNCTLLACSANLNQATNAMNPNSKGIKTGSACLIKDCLANQNQAIGIQGSTYCNVQDCVAVGNTGASQGDGIAVGDHSLVRGCVVKNSYGIAIGSNCLVAENSCDNALNDVYVSATNNVIIRNSFASANPISGGGSSAVGTIETGTVSLNTNKNPHANFKP